MDSDEGVLRATKFRADHRFGDYCERRESKRFDDLRADAGCHSSHIWSEWKEACALTRATTTVDATEICDNVASPQESLDKASRAKCASDGADGSLDARMLGFRALANFVSVLNRGSASMRHCSNSPLRLSAHDSLMTCVDNVMSGFFASNLIVLWTMVTFEV